MVKPKLPYETHLSSQLRNKPHKPVIVCFAYSIQVLDKPKMIKMLSFKFYKCNLNNISRLDYNFSTQAKQPPLMASSIKILINSLVMQISQKQTATVTLYCNEY